MKGMRVGGVGEVNVPRPGKALRLFTVLAPEDTETGSSKDYKKYYTAGMVESTFAIVECLGRFKLGK